VSSPPLGTHELTNVDKEREKALYPGRVLLTSKSVTLIPPSALSGALQTGRMIRERVS